MSRQVSFQKQQWHTLTYTTCPSFEPSVYGHKMNKLGKLGLLNYLQTYYQGQHEYILSLKVEGRNVKHSLLATDYARYNYRFRKASLVVTYYLMLGNPNHKNSRIIDRDC